MAGQPEWLSSGYLRVSMTGESRPMGVPTVGPAVRAEDSVDGRTVLAALGDEDCRAILEAVEAGPSTASEVADSSGTPLSTTYRKLEILSDAELLDERIRIRRDGKHVSEYYRSFEDVSVTVDDRGRIEVSVARRGDREPVDRRS